MSSERLRTQLQFENIIGGNDPLVWQNATKGQIKGFSFNPSHVVILESALSSDSLDFYYKGLLSLYEGLISLNKKNFSWATVKLYYSLYYFLRTSLCCKKIAFVRKEKDGYYFEAKPTKTPISNGRPADHFAAIELFKQFFGATDFLQSNRIEGILPYDWMRHQRENVNYRHRTFFEPDTPNVWDVISQECDNDGLEFWIDKYLNEDIYAFLDDHAVLAIPLRRLKLTHSDLINQGFRIIVRLEKEEKLKELINENRFLTQLRPFNRGNV